MARASLSATSIPAVSSDGLNLTDATFTTLSTGSGNGVEFTYDAKDLIFLKNDTAGSAEYTMVLITPSSISSVGGSVTSPAVTVAAGKTHIVRPSDIFKQTDGNMYIDCDVAGKIMVANL